RFASAAVGFGRGRGLTRMRRIAGANDLHRAASLLDPLPRRRAEAVGADGELLGQLAAREHLDGKAPLGEARGAERLGGHLVARREAGLEVGEIHRLGPGPEGLKRHRHLPVRASQLPGPHVDRILPALVSGLALVARPRARALLTPPRGLAQARALASANPLASVPRTRLGPHGVQADVLGRQAGAHRPPSSLTSTRCPTTRSIPRSSGPSAWLEARPIRPRRSERRVSRCFGLVPLAE